MQRYSRDPLRDESDREDRGAQARQDDRSSQGRYRDQRGEFAGRRESDLAHRGRHEGPAYGANPGSGHWREPVGERFERQYGHAPGGEDDERGGAGDYDERAAWQPGRWQYGETEYGVYGPRYTGAGSRGAGYGNERGDDRYGRQGYGQSGWQPEQENAQHHFDADYLQWRAEQIRNLDRDYQRYRQERYKKFCEDFGAWRKNRAAHTPTPMEGTPVGSTAQETDSQDLNASRDALGIPKSGK